MSQASLGGVVESARVLGLFQAYGIEMEYMIVDKDTLDPKPISDLVLQELAGGVISQEVELGRIAWSNELVLHVIELKANGPTSELNTLRDDFYQQVTQVNDILEKHNAILLPTAMHPWLEPLSQTRLWPHGDKVIYECYNRIFDCRGHGWSNLQSVHINLPFSGEEEFGRLHAAIRIALPLLPAIAASSPFIEGRPTGMLDSRLKVYQKNQAKIPSITGKIVPERCFDFQSYQTEILQNMYREIAPFDPKAILQEEWLNSRGAIARFDRDAIEIRVLDIQECVKADFTVIAAVVSLVKSLVDEHWISYEEQKSWDTSKLAHILFSFVEKGSLARIDEANYLKIFGIQSGSSTYLDLWMEIYQSLSKKNYLIRDVNECFEKILEHGSLAERMLKAFKNDKKSLKDIYSDLTQCLKENKMFGIK